MLAELAVDVQYSHDPADRLAKSRHCLAQPGQSIVDYRQTDIAPGDRAAQVWPLAGGSSSVDGAAAGPSRRQAVAA